MSDQKTTQVAFTGKASEYFGIWIVNLLLTILTLGIYSAWAKVRRKKYFHNNTLIDNVGFDYHAKPTSILKGRIIAFIFFMAYAFGGKINPLISGIFVILFFIALPWLVVRAKLFNARNTSHRGLRFDFVGKVGEAAYVFLLLPIVSAISLGLAFPFVQQQKNNFLMSKHKFGLSQFTMKATVGSFYRVYLILFIPMIIAIIGILSAIAIPAYKSYTERAQQQSAIIVPHAVGFMSVGENEAIVLAANEAEQTPYEVERIYSDNAPIDAVDSEYEAASETSEETLEEAMEEQIEAREKSAEESIKEMLSSPSKALFALIPLLLYILLIFGVTGYLKARIGNLVWNNTGLDGLSFKSSLRARDYVWLYFSNFAAIVMTFGLATPWAQVRMARYRASKLQVVGDVDFDQFVGEKRDAVKATGEEIADFFDVDISFG